MNKLELGKRISDFILGRKIEGRVAAVLPDIENQSRFIIDTGEEFLEVQNPITVSYTTVVPIPPLQEAELSRNQQVSRRFAKVKPWIDGQTI